MRLRRAFESEYDAKPKSRENAGGVHRGRPGCHGSVENLAAVAANRFADPWLGTTRPPFLAHKSAPHENTSAAFIVVRSAACTTANTMAAAEESDRGRNPDPGAWHGAFDKVWL